MKKRKSFSSQQYAYVFPIIHWPPQVSIDRLTLMNTIRSLMLRSQSSNKIFKERTWLLYSSGRRRVLVHTSTTVRTIHLINQKPHAYVSHYAIQKKYIWKRLLIFLVSQGNTMQLVVSEGVHYKQVRKIKIISLTWKNRQKHTHW